MQLLKLQCRSCGSPMEAKPGINRVRCPACGMTYLIERDSSRSPSGAVSDASGDHPVDVLLIPLSNTLPMHSWDYDSYNHLSGESTDMDYYAQNQSWDFLEKALRSQLTFVACLSYVTEETYTIDLGSFAVNQVLLYYEPLSVPPYLTSLSEDQVRKLVEPSKTYTHFQGISRLVRKGASYASYDAGQNARNNEIYLGRLEPLIRKYQLEFVDSEKYTKLEPERYRYKPLLGKVREKYRYWTTRYTSRRMYARIDPALARTFVPEDVIRNIERMRSVDCIEDMAAVIYREFSKEGDLDLHTFGYMALEIESSQIVIKNIRYIQSPTDRSRKWKGDQWVYITFSNYGMRPLDRQDLVHILASLLVRRLHELTRANHDTDWNLTYWYPSSGQDSKVGLSMQFMPAVKAVGVYKSWV